MHWHRLLLVIGLCCVSTVVWAGALSVPDHDFGSVSVSAGASSSIVTITNAGSNTNITAVTKAATAGCAEFTVTNVSGSLADGGTLNVPIAYDPVDRVADSCVINVASNASNAPVSFMLSGDGTASQISITSPANGTLSFANQRWNGGTPETLNLTLTNSGEEDVIPAQLGTSLVTGGQGFTIGTLSGTIMAGGGTATLPITFDPGSIGAHTDTVLINATNDPPGDGTSLVTLNGSGTQSQVSYSPSPLDLGNVGVGVSSTLPLTVSNIGTASLDINSLSITGSDASDFSFTDHGCAGTTCNLGAPVTIATGSEQFAIRCTPSAAGSRTATLQLTSSDPVPTLLTLSCTGTISMMSVSSTSLTFDNQDVNTSSSEQTFTVSNSGLAPLNYAVTAPSGFLVSVGGAQCRPTCSNLMVAPGDSTMVLVVFHPTTTEVTSGNVVVDDTDNRTPDVDVNVSGTGVEVTGGCCDGGSGGATYGLAIVVLFGLRKRRGR